MGVLDGKAIVVTGSTRGFGWALAQAFVREGAAVEVSSRSPDAVDKAVQALVAAGGQAGGLACDVGELEQVQALLADAVRRFGQVDVWVNNAGISPPYGPTAHVDPADFTRTIHTNVLGLYHGSLAAMRHFLPLRRGKLINVLGRGERSPVPMQNAYGSSKSWVRSFTLALAEEYKDSGVGVFALSPGMMDTELLTDVEVLPGYEQRLVNMESVVQALSQPPEVPARRAVWLASAATDGKTGLVVRELSGPKVMWRFMRLGLGRLLGRKGRPVTVQVRTASPGWPDAPRL